MDHYKSWSGLKKWLEDSLCEEFQGRITYTLTRYHKVHNAYGRAAIVLDGKELVCFEWMEAYHKEAAVAEALRQGNGNACLSLYDTMKPRWDANCTYDDHDFLGSVLIFRNLPIREALKSEDFIVKILAILDKRVGKRTLQRIKDSAEYKQYPAWAGQFFQLRLAAAMKQKSPLHGA